MVNSDVKKYFGMIVLNNLITNYTLDKLLDSLRYLLFNTYIQFAGHIFLKEKKVFQWMAVPHHLLVICF